MLVGIPRPYGNRLLLKVQQSSGEKMVGDLIVLASQTEEPLVGKVLDVGELVTDIGKDCRVLFSKYAGNVVTIDGEGYHVITTEDVELVWNPALALVEGDASTAVAG